MNGPTPSAGRTPQSTSGTLLAIAPFWKSTEGVRVGGRLGRLVLLSCRTFRRAAPVPCVGGGACRAVSAGTQAQSAALQSGLPRLEARVAAADRSPVQPSRLPPAVSSRCGGGLRRETRRSATVRMIVQISTNRRPLGNAGRHVRRRRRDLRQLRGRRRLATDRGNSGASRVWRDFGPTAPSTAGCPTGRDQRCRMARIGGSCSHQLS